MTSRILPREEWPRLAGTEAEGIWPHCDPAHTRVLVVEEAGEIVGVWMAIQMVHVEGAWIKPGYRHSPGVTRRLLLGMRTIAQHWGVSNVITAACDDAIRGLIGKLRGQQLPGDHYVIPMTTGVRVCQQP